MIERAMTTNTTVQSISRASAAIDAVCKRAVGGARLVHVATDCKLTKATAHRILKSLVEVGLVDQDVDTGLYFPGIKLVAISSTASNRFGLAKQSADGRSRIAERTGDTVFLTLRVRNESVCVARTEGSFPIKTLTLNVGDRRPLGIGAGPLAILSFLDDDVIATTIENSAPAYEPFGVKPAQVLAGVKRARAHGYSLDDEDILPGITGIGVPICGGRDDVVASLSVAAISERMRGNRRTNVVAWLKEEAERLERDLGPILSSRAAAGRTMVLGGS